MISRCTRRSVVGRLSLSGAILSALFASQGTAQAATSVFDGANRLVSTTEGATTVTYAYDGLGNLAKRCVNGTCTDLVLDDSSSLAQVVGEAAAGAATATTYAYGPAGVAAQRGTTPSYPMTDSLGTVRGLADAAGAIAGRRATDAFGATRSAVGAASGIGYAGEFTGAEDGKVWLRARSYDPKIGRFDQRDTFAGFAERGASLNRYSYAENNAANLTDPSGHFIPAIAWGALLLGTAAGFVSEMVFPSPVANGKQRPSQSDCDNERDYERNKFLWDLANGLWSGRNLIGAGGRAAARRAPKASLGSPKPPSQGFTPEEWLDGRNPGTGPFNDAVDEGVRCVGFTCAWAAGRSPMGLDGNPRVPASGGPESLDTAQKWFQKSGVSAGKTESFPTSAKAEDYMRSAPPGTKFFIGKPGVNEGGHAFGARIGSDGRLIVVDPSGGNAKNMMSNPGFADKTFVIKVQ